MLEKSCIAKCCREVLETSFGGVLEERWTKELEKRVVEECWRRVLEKSEGEKSRRDM